MTDWVKEMAREAIGPHEGQHDSPVESCTTCRCLMEGVDALIADALRAYAEEARKEEREECAALADEKWETYSADPVWRAAMQAASNEIAAAIRARGEGKG